MQDIPEGRENLKVSWLWPLVSELLQLSVLWSWFTWLEVDLFTCSGWWHCLLTPAGGEMTCCSDCCYTQLLHKHRVSCCFSSGLQQRAHSVSSLFKCCKTIGKLRKLKWQPLNEQIKDVQILACISITGLINQEPVPRGPRNLSVISLEMWQLCRGSNNSNNTRYSHLLIFQMR